ncbi:MAG: Ig-like domain repeat protein [Chloroflexi bacterium]|nr:Ig-like domain repeat protein [Chloroflexota bacterium]
MLLSDAYYFRLNQPAQVRRLVLIVFLMLLPLIPSKGVTFSPVQTVPADKAQVSTASSTANSNTAQTTTDTANAPVLENPTVSKSEEMPQGLYAAWIETQNREAAGDSNYRLETTEAGEIEGRNPAQGLKLSFQTNGVTINGMSLALTGIGYQDQVLEPPATVAPIANNNRVEYQRGRGLTEWYSNNPEGLEQGFTLTQAWPGRSAETNGNELALELSMTGGLFRNSGDGLTLVSGEGNLTHYRGLYVYDATGRRLESRMEVSGNDQPEGSTAHILVKLEGAQYPLVIDPMVQGQKLISTANTNGDQFGNAVALSSDGNIALIGAPKKIFAGTNMPQIWQGAAYIFTRTGSTWVQQQILTATNSAYGDQFGNAVALSSDGNTALVGAYWKWFGMNGNQGAAYIFTRTGAIWAQHQMLTSTNGAGNDYFGSAVALSSNGSTALIAAPGKENNQGAAYIFTQTNNTWTQQQILTATNGTANDQFGNAVALSSDGSTALMGAPNKIFGQNLNQGSAYIFTQTNNTWTQQAILTATNSSGWDHFGSAVALNSNGNTALVGAYSKYINGSNQGAAYIFTRTGFTWAQEGTALTSNSGAANDGFGSAVVLSSDGNIALIGANNKNGGQGAAYSFTRTNSTWTQQAILTAANGTAKDKFGNALALSGSGSTILIAASSKTMGGTGNQGATYIFIPTNITWTQQAVLSDTTGADWDYFGTAVALSSDGLTALIGAPLENIEGVVYAYTRTGSTWTQQTVIYPTNGGYGSNFGNAVALSSDGNIALIGANTQNGGQGAAYIFTRTNSTWAQEAVLTDTTGMGNDQFGVAVALGSNGNTALIGANNKGGGNNIWQGAAFVFTRTGSTWVQEAVLTDTTGISNDQFGAAVALSSDGNTALIGTLHKAITVSGVLHGNQGAAFVFTRTGSTWAQAQQLIDSNGNAGDQFGTAVTLSGEGNTALIGSPFKTFGTNNFQGAAYIFTQTGATWTQQAVLTTTNGMYGDQFGTAVALSSDGNIALIGAQWKSIGTNIAQGAAYILARTGATWTQQPQLTANDGNPNDHFGTAVALSGAGNIALIGAYNKTSGVNGNQGAAYTFGLQSTTITLTANPLATSDYGQTVTLTATISPTNTTGSVDFKDGSNTLNGSPVAIINGIATLTISTLITGSHTFTATYSGDIGYAGSNSNVINYKVYGIVIVNQITDNGLGNTVGTLSYALKYFTSTPLTITFALVNTNTINFNGPLNSSIRAGVAIDGGNTCGSPPSVVINGNGVTGDGLVLNGNNFLRNIWIKGFTKRQITTSALSLAPWVKNRLQCVWVSR